MSASKLPVALVGAAGALVAAAATSESTTRAVALACAAGLGLSLMLHGIGLRATFALVSVLALVGTGFGFVAEQWVSALALVICAAVTGYGTLRVRTVPSAQPGTAEADPWKMLDQQQDPTV